MSRKKVAFVIASEGFQPIEYNVPKKIIEDAGFEVVTVSDKPGTAIAKDGTTAEVDLLLNQVKPSEYQGIFFVGGPGAMEHLDNEVSYAIINQMKQEQKPFGAICISSRILAKAGALQGIKATGWNGDGALPALYQEYDVHYIPEPVIVHENIITATDPSAAIEFGNNIIKILNK